MGDPDVAKRIVDNRQMTQKSTCRSAFFSVNATTVTLNRLSGHIKPLSGFDERKKRQKKNNSHFMESPATRPSSTTFSPPSSSFKVQLGNKQKKTETKKKELVGGVRRHRRGRDRASGWRGWAGGPREGGGDGGGEVRSKVSDAGADRRQLLSTVGAEWPVDVPLVRIREDRGDKKNKQTNKQTNQPTNQSNKSKSKATQKRRGRLEERKRTVWTECRSVTGFCRRLFTEFCNDKNDDDDDDVDDDDDDGGPSRAINRR